MRLDDPQIERYSRQIILPELGAEGQMRLLGARVAILDDRAGGRGRDDGGHLLAHLTAAGVGTIAAPPALHAWADPGQPDSRLTGIAAAAAAPFDVAVLLGGEARGLPRATHVLWLAGGRVGELPPCPACVAAALPAPPPPPAVLAGVRDALLGALAATEVLKRLIGAGTPLGGRVLAYDPARATVTVETVTPRRACTACARAAGVEG